MGGVPRNGSGQVRCGPSAEIAGDAMPECASVDGSRHRLQSSVLLVERSRCGAAEEVPGGGLTDTRRPAENDASGVACRARPFATGSPARRPAPAHGATGQSAAKLAAVRRNSTRAASANPTAKTARAAVSSHSSSPPPPSGWTPKRVSIQSCHISVATAKAAAAAASPAYIQHVERPVACWRPLPLLMAAPRPSRRGPAVPGVIGVVRTGIRLGWGLGDEVAPGPEETAVAPCPARGQVVAVPLDSPRAVIAEPHDEVADDPHGAVRMVLPATPPQDHADFVARVDPEVGIGEGVVGIPDLQLADDRLGVRIHFDEPRVRVWEIETVVRALPAAGAPGQDDVP